MGVDHVRAQARRSETVAHASGGDRVPEEAQFMRPLLQRTLGHQRIELGERRIHGGPVPARRDGGAPRGIRGVGHAVGVEVIDLRSDGGDHHLWLRAVLLLQHRHRTVERPNRWRHRRLSGLAAAPAAKDPQSRLAAHQVLSMSLTSNCKGAANGGSGVSRPRNRAW